MPGIVRIHLRGPVQTLGALGKLPGTAIEIEQLQQSLRVIAFPIRSIEKLAEKFQHRRRRPPLRHKILHNRQKLAPFAALRLELSQLARERNSSVILLGIQQLSNEPGHLLHAVGILFEQLPHQRLRLRIAARGQKSLAIDIPKFRRILPGIHLRLENENRRSHLTLPQQAFAVG